MSGDPKPGRGGEMSPEPEVRGEWSHDGYRWLHLHAAPDDAVPSRWDSAARAYRCMACGATYLPEAQP